MNGLSNGFFEGEIAESVRCDTEMLVSSISLIVEIFKSLFWIELTFGWFDLRTDLPDGITTELCGLVLNKFLTPNSYGYPLVCRVTSRFLPDGLAPESLKDFIAGISIF
jgi:hypothetical protein